MPDAFRLSVSATTRSPRTGEKHGVDYHFLDKNVFEDKIQKNEFVEWIEVYEGGDFYGTLESELIDSEKSVILEIDVKGAKLVLERFPNAKTVFIEPKSIDVLKERLTNRGTETEEKKQQRLARALEELKHANNYQHRIINDDLDTAATELKSALTT